MTEITINRTCAIIDRCEQFTSGRVGARIKFSFSSEWAGLNKTAVFTNGGTTIDVLNVTDECVIPHEVLAISGKKLKVGVYGFTADDDGNIEIAIPTVYAELGKVAKGADPSGDESTEPSLPVWAQIQNDVSDLDDRVTELEEHGGGGGGETVNLWQGKIASFMGDSITAGTNTTKTYLEYLRETVGFSTTNNYGIGGSKISGDNGMCERVSSIAASSNIIFVFGGTNDFGGSVPMGEFYVTDASGNRTLTEDKTTFKGSLVKMCNWLTTNRSNANIILCTPIHRGIFGYSQTDLQKNSQNLYLEDYVAAVKEAAKIYSFVCIDLYGESGLNPNNEQNASLYFHANDRLHPNASGHKLIADTIRVKLPSIIPIVSVEILCEDIALDNNSISLNGAGSTQTLTATLTPANTTQPVVWTSSTPSVAIVQNGVVSAVSNGNTTITATCGTHSATCAVTVTGISEQVPCTGITLDRNTASVAEGETVTLVATPTPSDTTDPVVWSTSDSSKATVSNGVVTGVAEGNVTITATCGSYHADCVVTVTMGAIVMTPNVVINNNGTEGASVSSHAYTDYYPLKKAHRYTVQNGTAWQAIAIYKADKSIMLDGWSTTIVNSNTGGTFTFETPINGAFMRFSSTSGEHRDVATVTEIAPEVSTNTMLTANEWITTQNPFKNSIVPKSNWSALDSYYPVEVAGNYTITCAGAWITVAGYDAEFNFVSRISEGNGTSTTNTITIPDGVKYIRWNTSSADTTSSIVKNN